MSALFKELYRYLDHAVQLNVNEMLDEALRSTRVSMTTSERRQFYDKHINTGEEGIIYAHRKRLSFK